MGKNEPPPTEPPPIDPVPEPDPADDAAQQGDGDAVAQGDAIQQLLDAAATIRDRAHRMFTGPGKWPTPTPGTDPRAAAQAVRSAVQALAVELGALRQRLDDAAEAACKAALDAGVALDVAEGRIGRLREATVILLVWAQRHRGEGSETVRPADLTAECTGDIPEAHHRWNALWAEWSERSSAVRDAAAGVVKLGMDVQAHRTKKLEAEVEKDGPISPDRFRFDGKTARDLPPLQYKLLAELWAAGPLLTRLATDAIVEAVYGKPADHSNRRALYELAGRTRESLREARIFLRIEAKKKMIWLAPIPE